MYYKVIRVAAILLIILMLSLTAATAVTAAGNDVQWSTSAQAEAAAKRPVLVPYPIEPGIPEPPITVAPDRLRG